ncbi:hypothetical protein DM02DRAFT_669262 [Periconia macrospinosa]|uniref:Myb-like domain-containing protein n=1 Tax=Periconia macrospinosa TaxID=97972 RepID=A0A2V1E3N3_9PLEO|nr:hypothetical protein DM02DRAFT_669262 [Periconia macrospinosa]
MSIMNMQSISEMGWLVAHPYPASVRILPTDMLLWLHYNPLLGFHGFLVSKLHQLGDEERLRLFGVLSTHGWPVHLQTMENARFQILPGSPWAPADDMALIIIRDTPLPFDVIARVFFEGRSEAECQVRHEYLVACGTAQKVRDTLTEKSPQPEAQPFPPYDDSNFNKENEPQGHQQHTMQAREDVVSNRSFSFNTENPDTPTPINKEITPQSREAKERLARLMEGTPGSELSSARSSISDCKPSDSPAPVNSPLVPQAKTAEKVLKQRVNEASDTPQAYESPGNYISVSTPKGVWTAQDVKVLQDGIANGMTGQEMQRAYFPSRTVGAIDTKISKSKRSGISFKAGTHWTDKDRHDLVFLAQEGHSWEDIAARHFPEKTPEQCQEYHRCITMKVGLKAHAIEGSNVEGKNAEVDMKVRCVAVGGMDGKGSVQASASAAPPLQPTDTFPQNNGQVKFVSTPAAKAIDHELQAARDNAIDILLPQANDETKASLKSALDHSSWPSHLTSLEAYHSNAPRTKSKWSIEDSTALQCIRMLPVQPSNKACAKAFFPTRTADGVRTHGLILTKKAARSRQPEEDDQEMDDLSLV